MIVHEENVPAIKSKQSRRPQARTEKARSSMISVATSMFAEKGYDATAIRDVEIKAGVQRGMLIYHFGSKKDFWKRVVDSIWSIIKSKREEHISILA
ncbi:MAG: helix-turn-helix domain containing protein, partial [Porticoccaceae bacterium]|nr:helix-turn-helix domain containing protein [Porticoccaceae bacterium]